MQKYRLKFAISVMAQAFIMLALLVMPSNTQATLQNSESTIRQALQAVKKNQWQTGERLIAASKDPLARDLYYWFYYRDSSNKNVSYAKLARFARARADWPKMGTVRARVEKTMPDTIKATDAVAWFNDYEPRSARGFFIYANALVGTGQNQKAKALITKWWAEKPLSRNEQKKLYATYHRYIGAASHRKRLDNLIDKRQYTNARAVATVLGQGYPELTEARIALASQKSNVNDVIARVPSKFQNDPGLLFERLRWRRRKKLNSGAIEILNKAPNMSRVFNASEWWQERHIVIRRLIEDKKFRQAYEFLAGWIALRKRSQPAHALDHFTKLYNNVKSPISKARGAYWAGRAETEMGNTARATEWYNRAARFQTTFYGQTAGTQLGSRTALNFAAPPNLTAEDISRFNADDQIRAAKILHKTGLKKDSGLFLKSFVAEEKTPKAYIFATKLASDMKDNFAAVQIAKEATNKGLFFTAQSFPTITNDLRNVSTDWAFVHSLIRQESQFNQYANSPVGALGLMQLMPGTAKETAGKIGLRYSKSQLTANPSYNIALGSEYMRRMLARYAGSYPLAIAAYNAGPGRVDRWLKIYGDPRLGNTDLLDWIETIPIYETRNYVQRVLEGTYIYHLRLKRVKPDTKKPIHLVQQY